LPAAADQHKLVPKCQGLPCGEQLQLRCHSKSEQGQWSIDNRTLELTVLRLQGVGGNAEVYLVELFSHSLTPGTEAAAAAAAGQQQADAGADGGAANAAAKWWRGLDYCKKAADATSAPGTTSLYKPRQLFVLKVPLPYDCNSPAAQQPGHYPIHFANACEVLQQEHQLLSRMADCDGILHSHAYGLITYGPFELQQLPCLLLELADGSVQQRLGECQAAAAAAAATGPPPRPVGLPDGEVWQIIKQVLPGLADLSAAGIVWKNVSLANTLFITRGVRKSVVMCDFGSGVLVGADGLETAPAAAGTAAFMSPELKYGRRVGPACDVWGLGCMLLALRLGREVQLLPAVEPEDAPASWDAAAVLRKFESELQPAEFAFVVQCLAYDPAKRPSPRELLCYADSENLTY
jgi:serine/threonine protein kinase